MVTTKAKRAEKEYVMFSVCAPTLTKQKQEVEFAFGVCLTLGFSLSLVIKTVPSSIIPWSYTLAQESTDWLVVFSSYSETDLCSCSFPKEPEVIALQVHVGDEAGRGSALCLLLLQPSKPSLWLCWALLGLLDSAGSSGLAHLSKLSGFSSPLGQSDFCSFGYSKLERN